MADEDKAQLTDGTIDNEESDPEDVAEIIDFGNVEGAGDGQLRG